MAKARSRNYPSMSLGEAIERARALYKQEGKARVPATVAVAAWGYNSLNGASLRSLSALRQYGLLEGGNDDTKLSERALTILLEPEASPEYADALHGALAEPALFQDILAEYGENVPSDAALVSYLVRKQNFGEGAANTLIEAYRDSVELVQSKTTSYIQPVPVSSAVELRRQTELGKPMRQNEMQVVTSTGDLNFSWPLSKNSVLSIRIVGEMPSPDDVIELPTLLELARGKIEREVRKAAKTAVELTTDYTVE